MRTLSTLVVFAIFCSTVRGQPSLKEHVWPDSGSWDPNVTGFPEAGAVMLDVVESVTILDHNRERVYVNAPTGTQVRYSARFLFRSANAVDDFKKMSFEFGGSWKLSIFDGRVFRKDGTVIDLSRGHFPIRYLDPERQTRRRYSVSLVDVPVETGDQMELTLSYGNPFPAETSPAPVQDKMPVLRKQLDITMEKGLPFDVRTYNGFPQADVDSSGTKIRKSWIFHDLDALSADPFQFRPAFAPMWEVAYTGLLRMHAWSLFEQEHPYEKYHGRDGSQAFTRFIEDRKTALGSPSDSLLITDVLQFLRDSVTIVHEHATTSNDPIGAIFLTREMTRADCMVLFRQLFGILDLPLIAVGTRHKALGQTHDGGLRPDEVSAYMVAYMSADSNLVVVAPPTPTNWYPLGAIPAEYSGQAALVTWPEDERGLRHQLYSIALPESTHSDNLIRERYQVTMKGPTEMAHAKGKGSMNGHPAHTRPAKRHQDGPSRILFPPSGHGERDSVSVTYSSERSTEFTFSIRPGILSGTTGPADTVTLSIGTLLDMAVFTMEDDCTKDRLFPYPYDHQRDVYLSFPHDIEIVPAPVSSLTNGVGRCAVSVDMVSHKTIRVRAEVSLVNNMVPARALGDFCALNGAIKELKALSIRYVAHGP